MIGKFLTSLFSDLTYNEYRWYNLDCAQQRDFYGLNEFLYKENDDSDYEYEGNIFVHYLSM